MAIRCNPPLILAEVGHEDTNYNNPWFCFGRSKMILQGGDVWLYVLTKKQEKCNNRDGLVSFVGTGEVYIAAVEQGP